MHKPLVSICLPIFNGAEFLEETLISISNQIYGNLELIVSDNFSTDNSIEIIRKFASNINFPVLILQRERSGIGDNWNNCIKNSNGDYIKFIFQDDILYPDCISKMMACFDDHSNIELVASKRKILTRDIEEWQTNWISRYCDLQDFVSSGINKENLILDHKIFKHPKFLTDPFNKIGEPSVIMFPKTLIEKIGYFRTDMDIILDIEFYYRVLERYKVLILNEELVGFRLHSDQASRKNKKSLKSDFEIFQSLLLKRYFFLLRKSDKIKVLDYFFKTRLRDRIKGLKLL